MKAQIVVLCEDKAQATFIRCFLHLRGYKDNHRLRFLALRDEPVVLVSNTSESTTLTNCVPYGINRTAV